MFSCLTLTTCNYHFDRKVFRKWFFFSIGEIRDKNGHPLPVTPVGAISVEVCESQVAQCSAVWTWQLLYSAGRTRVMNEIIALIVKRTPEMKYKSKSKYQLLSDKLSKAFTMVKTFEFNTENMSLIKHYLKLRKDFENFRIYFFIITPFKYYKSWQLLAVVTLTLVVWLFEVTCLILGVIMMTTLKAWSSSQANTNHYAGWKTNVVVKITV